MYDYVIVGAGSAGCVLANRLSADPAVTVALIEAGGADRKQEIRIPAAFSKLFKTPLDWDFTTTPQKYAADREMYWPRGKMLGGSSSINAMMWVRGHRDDYDGWALDGWRYDDVLPYFHRIEHREGSNNGGVYGTGGPLWIEELRDPHPLTAAFLKACGEAGMTGLGELNEPDNTGYSRTPVTQHRGRRWSAADAYLHPVRKRENLTVFTGALAQRILFDGGTGAGPRATGVRFQAPNGDIRDVTARREVILAAGAIGSPHLLMLSGIGDPGALGTHGIPLVAAASEVGRNLQDHLASGAIMHTHVVTMADAEKIGPLLRYLTARKGMLSSNVAEAVAFIRTGDHVSAPDIELLFAPTPFLDHGFTKPPGQGFTIAAILLQPQSRGEITLASADPQAAPLIDAGYLSDDADMRTLVAGTKAALELLETAALKPFAGAPMRPDRFPDSDSDIEDFIRAYAETLYHPAGTCRMGADGSSVVDPELRVRGVAGLRIADASVMPRIIRGHTHAPTVMIAEKAADLILGVTATS